MKKLLFRIAVMIGVLGVFAYYIFQNFGTIENTVSVTLSQSLGYLFIAFIFTVLGFLCLTATSYTVFRMIGIRRTMWQMFSLRAQGLAINVLVPSGGVSVGVVFAGDAKRKGSSEAAAITGVILVLLAEYAAIFLLLIIAVTYLLSIDSLTWVIVLTAIAFFALAVGMALLVYLAGKNQTLLKKVLEYSKLRLNKLSNFFKRGNIVKNETVVDNFINELTNAYQVIVREKKQRYLVLGYTLASHIMFLASIYVLFLSLGLEPLYRIMLTGYAIGLVTIIISPTPNGVGFVEGVMALSYASMGVPAAAATTVTLVYRGLSFWLPFFIGFAALQKRNLADVVIARKK